jgi:hypothetical protein
VRREYKKMRRRRTNRVLMARGACSGTGRAFI